MFNLYADVICLTVIIHSNLKTFYPKLIEECYILNKKNLKIYIMRGGFLSTEVWKLINTNEICNKIKWITQDGLVVKWNEGIMCFRQGHDLWHCKSSSCASWKPLECSQESIILALEHFLLKGNGKAIFVRFVTP